MRVAILLSGSIFLTVVQAANRAEIEDSTEDGDNFIPFSGRREDRFDWLLCAALDERVPGNVIASPFSVKSLLILLYEASVGHTKKELADTLEISNMTNSVIRAQASARLITLKAPSPFYEMTIENRMYVDRGLSVREWYKNVLYNYYGTGIEKINFHSSSAAAKINKWVATVTRGHIQNFIDENGDILRDTEIMLLNAIYFHGKWRAPFSKSESFQGNFLSPGKPEAVTYMTRSGLYYMSESDELDARLLRLPYEGKKFSMYILLPRQVDGLNTLLSKVSPFQMRRLMQAMEETSVQLILPSFKFEFKMNLKKTLSEMGLESIFSKGEDIKVIKKKKNKKTKDPVVSDIIHKATIQVTEAGTVATAVTEMEFINKLGIPEIEFNVSHPFLFYIEDEVTGTNIFIGKLVNPAVTADTLDFIQRDRVEGPRFLTNEKYHDPYLGYDHYIFPYNKVHRGEHN